MAGTPPLFCSLVAHTNRQGWQVMNQIEAHPLNLQDDLVQFCKEHNIAMTAYSPLGNNSELPIPGPHHVPCERSDETLAVAGAPLLTEYPEVQEIAKKLNATPAQVLIAWGARKGFSVIPKSVQEDRIKSNFQQASVFLLVATIVLTFGHR